MPWKQDLAELIRSRWRPGQNFTLRQVYEFEQDLRKSYPKNGHIRAKIRQTLQYLRAEGSISFVDARGTYLRLR